MSFIKENLHDGEFLVTFDYAENYSSKIQDTVRSYHWSNDQATLHPYVIYYKNETTIVNECFVVVSEMNKHNRVAVHLFNTEMIDHLKLIFGSEYVKRIIFFSDGCVDEYKSKFNFANLLHHKADFDVDTEWHFFSTSHGMGGLWWSRRYREKIGISCEFAKACQWSNCYTSSIISVGRIIFR